MNTCLVSGKFHTIQGTGCLGDLAMCKKQYKRRILELIFIRNACPNELKLATSNN